MIGESLLVNLDEKISYPLTDMRDINGRFCGGEDMLKFESKLSMEEIEENFKDFDLYESLIKSLDEALAYAHGEVVDGVKTTKITKDL